nr:hypothetical protein [Tanacetum cinerariifolium]
MSSTPLSRHLIVVFQRELLEEEYWGSLLRAAYFEIRLEDKEKLEWFRSMVMESQFRVRRYVDSATSFVAYETWVSMLGVSVLAKLLVTSVGVIGTTLFVSCIWATLSLNLLQVGVVVCGLVVADVVVVESLSSGMSVKIVGPRIALRMKSGFLILLPGELKVMICAFKKDGNSCVSLFSSPLATSLQSATILWAFGLKHVNDTVVIPSSMIALKQ